jgi:hypothetical protein
MLIGLFRMRLRAGGAFGLGRFLWSQVRWWKFSPAVILPNLPMLIPVHQGLIWFLIATVAEVPPVVRLAILLDRSPLLLAHSYSTSQVFVFLNLNGRILFSRIHQQRVVDRTLFR